MRAVPNSTVDTSAARGAVVDRGGHPLGQRVDRLGGHPHDLDARLGEPVELAAQAVELAVRGHQPRAAAARGRGPTAAGSSSSWVLSAEGDLGVRVVEPRPAPRRGPGRPARSASAHLSSTASAASSKRRDQALAGHVGPRLVRVAGEQEPVRHPEPPVVRRRGRSASGQPVEQGPIGPGRGRRRRSQVAPDGPQVGERRVPQRGAQVGGARRSAGAGLVADRALDHLHVPVAPLLHALVDVDEALGDLRRARRRRGTRPGAPDGPRRRARAGGARPGRGRRAARRSPGRRGTARNESNNDGRTIAAATRRRAAPSG